MVTALDIFINHGVVGEDLQQEVNIRLEVAPPIPRLMTLTVLSGTIATVGDNATIEGGTSVTYPNVATSDERTIFVQGRFQGNAQFQD